jgi:tetratricopeptide (TPR) repeat protein
LNRTKVEVNIKSSMSALLAVAVFSLFPHNAYSAPRVGMRIIPDLIIPYGNPSETKKDGETLELYSVGYGVDLAVDLSYLGFLSPFLKVGANVVPLNGVSNANLLSIQGGAGLSYYAYPVPRLMLRAGADGGLAYASVTKTSAGGALKGIGYYWGTQAEIGYRFSPDFGILGNVGYSQLLGDSSAIFRGFSAGLVFNVGLDRLWRQASGLVAEVKKQEELFPITYYQSDKKPIAYLQLLNGEEAEIRDVKVSFSAGTYTSRAADCGAFKLILHNDRVETPIYANFNDKVLGFSETTKIQGELTVEYKILDSTRKITKAITIVFNNRNAATWADPRVVAAFISPQDPVMLELSKYFAGLIRVRSRAEIDKNLQYGMGLFEGLRIYGLVWTEDPNTPYTVAIKDTSKIAYLQYPYQTLSYKSGDSDALALALAEALESVAVPAAIAALPEDVIVAFPLDASETQVRTTFSNLRNFIFEAGKVWVPLRVSMIRDGFLRAWQAGADLWKAQPQGGGAKLIKIEESWTSFSPIALANIDFRPVKPAEETFVLAFENTLGRFVSAEVEPKATRLLSEMKDGGTGRQRNNLGVVYAQYGMYTEANAEFAMSVAKGYTPALVNLANIAFILKQYDIAATYFEQALKAEPGNKVALIGLARACYEQNRLPEVDALFAQVKALDPVLAERYSYLASKVDSAQAPQSSASNVGRATNWESE